MREERGALETIVRWAIILVIGMVVLKLIFAALGIATVLFAVALKLLPWVIAIWIAIKVWDWLRGDRGAGAGTTNV